MAANIDALLRHGTVSTRAMNRQLAKTTSQASKMADFDADDRDEGARGRPSGPSGYRNRHLNNKRAQRAHSAIAGPPGERLGAKQRKGQPSVAHIDREQGPKDPPQADLHPSEARRPMAPVAKRRPPPTGGLYGGGGRNTQ